ncbi:hexokinase [Parabacteroides sp. PF5-9]|uniref:hexokinase family protein n=1 Tax=Parabacteroides sp. PF5-9 TaxID=1742404 RepID=UPI0024756ECB|nr:hexokinase [Parabacteroides sp. PF5-9]MDH6357523.1 hexokinase [Parabacteroides sp. PF5-9]
MNTNIFKLTSEQLKEIAQSLHDKVENGLANDNTEVQCIPTFIIPKSSGVEGTALVLDLGGTNYRVATVEFTEKGPKIHPENGWKKDLSVMKTPGFTQENLFKEQADPIGEIKRNKEMPIGYCFSYPAESMLDGDAKLLRWTKGVDIKEMIDKPIGKPFMDYLNTQNDPKFTGVKVINDTVASLFAGLSHTNYDAYIGLIVGTGTNMATFIHSDKISKLDPSSNIKGLLPINLESGNFNPPFLTEVDDRVDANSDSQGRQRFEKAVSGMYLGEILKTFFCNDEFEKKFDAEKLTTMMSYPGIYKEEYVEIARCIYERSAKLVAASLAGLVNVIVSHDNSIKRVLLTAEGSLFWSQDKRGKNYKDIVNDELHSLLAAFGHGDVHVDINQMDNANLIGTAVAALS